MLPSSTLSSFSFLLEASPTPIYRRITDAYQQTFTQQGYAVTYFEPHQYTDLANAVAAFRELLQAQVATHLLLFDNSQIPLLVHPDGHFLLEEFAGHLVFLHHDNLANSLVKLGGSQATKVLDLWQRLKHRSSHFCLESTNCLDLQALGMTRCYPIVHGSEFTPLDRPPTYDYDVSFVGHVLPSIELIFPEFEPLPYSHRLAQSLWSRLVRLDHACDRDAIAYASQVSHSTNPLFITHKFAYLHALGLLSLPLRGELLKRLNPEFAIAIIGGDPSYLHGSKTQHQLTGQHISYRSATPDYTETATIYHQSKINLNITSTQFDHAVNNRVVDVAAIGGFILTDWKSDLPRLTQVSEAISYRSLEELNDKIAYYLERPTERQEIADQLHQDLQASCTYDRVIEDLIETLLPPQISDGS